MNAQLEASVEELRADLKTADRLESELETVEKQLAQARIERESLRSQVAGIPGLKQAIADKNACIAMLTTDLADLAKITCESDERAND